MWKRPPGPSLSALLFLLFLFTISAICALAEPIPIVVEGQPVPGVGTVTRIDNVAVNGAGEWLVEADTDFANADQDQVLLDRNGVRLREDDPLPEPPGAHLDSFDSINVNENGDSGWNFFLTGTTGTNDNSGIYFNTALVIQESEVSTAPQLTPGTPYLGFFDAKLNNLNRMTIVATVDDLAIPTSVDQAIVRLDLDNLGNLLGETVIAKEGDILPGQIEQVAIFGTGPHQSAFNDAAQVLFLADLTGSTATDGVLYLDDTLLAQEGSPSPDPGRNYEIILGRGLDLNASGSHVFKANLDGATDDDEVIVKDGAIFKREGENFPAIGPFRLEGFGSSSGPIYIDDDGSVLWYGDWDDPNTEADTGLFLNEDLIVEEGTAAGGAVLDEIASGVDAFMLSDNGDWLIFEGTLAGGINGAFIVDLRSPSAVASSSVPTAPVRLWSSPNPFRGVTTLHYTLATESRIDLSIYDTSGRFVARLDRGRRDAGRHTAAWDGRDAAGRSLGAGAYFVRLASGEDSALQIIERKIVRVR
jgi:hypothetical protein